jgi:deazaflavin-dependent oxidoreductase (nitroreductase family)
MTADGPVNDTRGTSKIPPIPKHAEVEDNPGILSAFNAAVVEEFRASGGRVGGPFEGSDVLLLTTTGAKSRQPRLTPLEYFTVDSRLFIVGTRGGAPNHPAWVHNLRAHPRAHVEIGNEHYDVVADEFTGPERDAAFSKIVELCPRIETYPVTSRVIPVFELSRTTPTDR